MKLKPKTVFKSHKIKCIFFLSLKNPLNIILRLKNKLKSLFSKSPVTWPFLLDALFDKKTKTKEKDIQKHHWFINFET